MSCRPPRFVFKAALVALIASLVATITPVAAQRYPTPVTPVEPPEPSSEGSVAGTIPDITLPPNAPNDDPIYWSGTVILGTPRRITVAIMLGEISPISSSIPVSITSASPINLEPGSALKLSLPLADADIATVKWYRADDVLTASGSTLELADVTIADSATYSATVTTKTGNSRFFTAGAIRVETPRRQRLLNLSSRAIIAPANPVFIGGFVVDGSPGRLHETKTILLRAVGPSLAKLGVTRPLADPTIKLFHADGSLVDLSTAITKTKNTTVLLAQNAAGAFGLSADAPEGVILIKLPAGAYSAHVASASGGSGDVLLEIYEIPETAFLSPP